MDMLGLLKRLEWGYDLTCPSPECNRAKWDNNTGELNPHYPDCQLKAAIVALEAGRLVVVEKTAYNTRRVIHAMRLEKERKEKEQGT